LSGLEAPKGAKSGFKMWIEFEKGAKIAILHE